MSACVSSNLTPRIKVRIVKSNIEKPSIIRWLRVLDGIAADAKNAGNVRSIRRYLTAPRRRRVSVNLGKLEEYVKESENIVVPGKVLGLGSVSKKFAVSAVEFSLSAQGSLEKAGCSIIDISEMIKKENIRIIV